MKKVSKPKRIGTRGNQIVISTAEWLSHWVTPLKNSIHDVVDSDELDHAESEADKSDEGGDDSDNEGPADVEWPQRVHALSKVGQNSPVVTLDVFTEVASLDAHYDQWHQDHATCVTKRNMPQKSRHNTIQWRHQDHATCVTKRNMSHKACQNPLQWHSGSCNMRHREKQSITCQSSSVTTSGSCNLRHKEKHEPWFKVFLEIWFILCHPGMTFVVGWALNFNSLTHSLTN